MALNIKDKIAEPKWEAIPSEMKSIPHWLVWRAEPSNKRPGEQDKRPKNLDGTGFSGWQNTKNLFSYEEVKQAYSTGAFSGIGFAPKGTDFVVVDLDNDEGISHISEELRGISKGGYAEVSPSGRGIHVWMKGTVSDNLKRKVTIRTGEKIEFFTNSGWLTVTGEHFNKQQPHENQQLIDTIIQRYEFERKPEHKTYSKPSDFTTCDLNQFEIMQAIANSTVGGKIQKLLDGNISEYQGDNSSADQGLMNHLAFFTGKDAAMMDAIYRESGLYRKKWDKVHSADGQTYGQMTISKAIEGTGEVYSPRKRDGYSVTIHDEKKSKKKYYSYDDTGNADRFVDMFGAVTLFCNPDNTFYHYNGKFWEKDSLAVTRSLMDEAMEAAVKEPVVVPRKVSEKEQEEYIKAKAKWDKCCRSTRVKNYAMTEIKHRLPVIMDQFDNDIYAFNVQNGWIDLNTGKLQPHDSRKKFTKIAGAELIEQGCPKWKTFLGKIFSGDLEVIDFIQKLIGYSMIGKNLEKKIIFLYGKSGDNGKSVMIRILEALFGTYKKTVAPTALMKSSNGSDSGHTDKLAHMAGARLVTSTEPEKGFKLSESMVKAMTGDDTISASFKGKTEFEFSPQNTIWLACNHIPQMDAGTEDNPIWKRVLIVPFNVQIPPEEQDRHLSEKIIEQELSGVLNWCLEGLKKYLAEGLEIPQVVELATIHKRQEMDYIKDFLVECFEFAPGNRVSTSVMHKTYVEWAKSHGINNFMKQKDLTEDIQGRGYSTMHTNKGNVFLDISATNALNEKEKRVSVR